MKKHIIVAFVVGILVTIFCYHAYTIYSLKSQLMAVESVVSQDDATIKQIVTLINNTNGKK